MSEKNPTNPPKVRPELKTEKPGTRQTLKTGKPEFETNKGSTSC